MRKDRGARSHLRKAHNDCISLCVVCRLAQSAWASGGSLLGRRACMQLDRLIQTHKVLLRGQSKEWAMDTKAENQATDTEE